MNMHLSDRGKVELSNLNRQAFNLDHVNQYKSSVVKQKMLTINPLANITHEINYVADIDDIKKDSIHYEITQRSNIEAWDCIATCLECWGNEKKELE